MKRPPPPVRAIIILLLDRILSRLSQSEQGGPHAACHPVIRASHALQGGESGLQLIAGRPYLAELGQALTIDTLRLGVAPAGIRIIRGTHG